MQGVSGWNVLSGHRQRRTDTMSRWNVLSVGKLIGVHDPLPERLVFSVGQPDDGHGNVHRVSDRHVLSGPGGGTDRLSSGLLLSDGQCIATGRMPDRHVQHRDQRDEQRDLHAVRHGHVPVFDGTNIMYGVWCANLQQPDRTNIERSMCRMCLQRWNLFGHWTSCVHGVPECLLSVHVYLRIHHGLC